MKYFIKTFGCQQNEADSERIAAQFVARGFSKAKNYHEADVVVINSCMVRQSAEDRVYGLVRNLAKIKQNKIAEGKSYKIIVTGCMVGLAVRDKSGRFLKQIRNRMPEVDEFLAIEEVGFNYELIRQDKINAFVPISYGCNNFCSYCIVPFTRGREVSRPYEEIIAEAKSLKSKGYKDITLLGQNVNSYGADFFRNNISLQKTNAAISGTTASRLPYPLVLLQNSCRDISKQIKPIYVKHLGRYRIPTLFPYLLEDVARLGFEKVDFISANPWDFSKELIAVIARNKNISRTIHLPVQSGDDNVLKRMNRWYTAKQYLALISKIKKQIPKVQFTTDIIVGFPGETDEEFENTVKLCKKVGFVKAYVAMYSPRFGTFASKTMKDDVPYTIKKKRWQILEDLIYKSKRKLISSSNGQIEHK